MKVLSGVSAAPGIVIGKALLFPDDNPEIPRYSIESGKTVSEMERFVSAVKGAAEELGRLKENSLAVEKGQVSIFDACLMMLEDPDFHYRIKARLESRFENIEWIVFEVGRDLSQKLAQSPNAYLRGRAIDVSDVSRRIINRLLGLRRFSFEGLAEDVILAAKNLLPFDALSLNKSRVKALVLDAGSRISHTAILARAFGIPSVVGLSTLVREVADGDTLIVDGDAGQVILDPDAAALKRYGEKIAGKTRGFEKSAELKELPPETKDGRRVRLMANIGIPEEAEGLESFGAEGIGLYRSEFLFLQNVQGSEEWQYQAYLRVVQAMRGKPVTIRTIDIGGDKIVPGLEVKEENPLLGWRAIRFSLSLPEMFKVQLRAILRAGAEGPVRIMFPMISCIEELEQALILLEEARADCLRRGQAIGKDMEAGVMIEIPAAVLIAGALAEKSAFFSIGTNDLIQYTLAVDRGNEKVSYLARPAHPAVLHFIKQTIDAAHAKGRPAAMCGELAGEPWAAAMLIGMGLDEFSMNAPAIPRVKEIIRDVDFESCKRLVEDVLAAVSNKQVRSCIAEWHREHLPGSGIAEFFTEKG